MRRRDLLASIAVGAAAPATAVGAGGDSSLPVRRRNAASGATVVPPLVFDSTSSLLDPSGEPLTDAGTVAVVAHDSARSEDSDDGGDAVSYGATPIPLVGLDRPVVGFGAMLATDDTDFAYGNEEFLLNVWDDVVDGGRILWDEGHDQYYSLDRFSTFRSFAEEQGYTVARTSSLVEDLGDADGVVITSPSVAITDEELSALASFADDGGGVFLHDQSDYRNFDETGNLNAIAGSLDVAFRFNDDQVFDDEHNAGPPFVITTDRFDAERFGALFESRQGIDAGPRFQVDQQYAATVVDVADGDTVDVELEDGSAETVRVLGVDTPETPDNGEFENPHEWEGLGGVAVDDDYPYLGERGARATEFAESTVAGRDVTLSFDASEGIADPFGRLLAHVELPDGSSYGDRLIAEGHARVFDSTLARHDALIETELEAREAGRGLWAESRPDETEPFRNRPVEELFFPTPAAVTTTGGSIPDERVAVSARDSASPAGAPLVGIDAENRVAVVGAPSIDERYESDVGFEGSTAEYDHFTFLTNLLTALSDREGDVLIDGGHGQFGPQWTVCGEDASFYQHHLEGVDIGFEQVNGYRGALLRRGRALLVSTPAESIPERVTDAIVEFRDAGGAVVLLGSGAAPDEATIDLNAVATALGTDLRVGLETVTDPESNVGGSEGLVVTDAIAERYALTTPYGEGAPGLTETEPSTTTSSATTTGDGGTTEQATPGFGVGTALAGLGAAAYGIARLLGSDADTDD